MPRPFGLNNNLHASDPTREAHGDWPYHPRNDLAHLDGAPLDDLDRDANHSFVRIVVGAICVFFVVIALCVLMIALAHATWREDFAKHSTALKLWFQNAEVAPTAHPRLSFVGCCERSERYHTKFLVNVTDGGDEWSYQLPDGSWKRIPPDIIHHESIRAADDAEARDPQVKAEFDQLRNEGVLFILGSGLETCFWPPEPQG